MHSDVRSAKLQKNTLIGTDRHSSSSVIKQPEVRSVSQNQGIHHEQTLTSNNGNELSANGEKDTGTTTKVNHGKEKSNSQKSQPQQAAKAPKSRAENLIPQNDVRFQEVVSHKNQTVFMPKGAIDQFPKEMFNKLVKSTHLLIQQGGSQMHIQLKPDILGSIRLLVETVQNQINVKILVSKPDTHHLLEQHIQALQHSLVNQGFKIENVQISLNVQTDPFQQGQLFQNQQQQGSAFAQKEEQNHFSESGNLFNQQNEKQKSTARTRRFGYNSMEYIA